MIRVLLRVAVSALLALTVGFIAFPARAYADTVPHVSGTGDLGLALRSQPSFTSPRLDTIPEGDALAVVCQTTGDDVFGSPVWDRLESGGYVADWYVDGVAAGALPACPALPSPTEAVPAEAVPADSTPVEPATPAGPGIGYDRAGAAQWAVDHAFDEPEIEGADCANFVSAALHLGGGIEVTDWWRPWSLSWVRADDLAFELSAHGYLSRIDIEPSDSTIPAAELGDVVLYDTGDGGGYHHVSIVVRIGPSGVVEVASHTNAYDYRVWNQSWLDREDRTGFRAQLLHVLSS